MRALLAGALFSLAACALALEDDKGEQKVGGGGTCFVGGCSGQICTDSDDVASTCEWRSEYACFKSATCERQPDGNCGWTTTPELLSCLESQ